MPPEPPASKSALAPLRHRAFRALAFGRAISLLGNGVAPMALSFAVLDLTHSVGDLGLVVGARSLFNVVFLLFGGVLADRLPRHLVLVGSGVLSACSQAAVATLVLTHTATVPLLIVLSAANGTFAAVSMPASSALVPQTIPPELRQSANALNRMAANTASILGTALGGMLVAGVGPGWGLVVDSASFALSTLFFLRVRLPQETAVELEPKKPGLLSELREGWSEFVSRTWIWVIVLAFGFINAAFAGGVSLLGPVIADSSFGRGAWGFVLASETVGMLLGGVVALRYRPRHLLLVGCVCAGTLTMLPLGLALGLPVSVMLLLGLVSGVCIEQFSVAWETSLQQEVPADRLARVYSYDMVGSYVAIPLAQITTEPLAAAVGVRPALYCATGVIAVSTLAMLSVREVRTFRVSSGQPEAEPIGGLADDLAGGEQAPLGAAG